MVDIGIIHNAAVQLRTISFDYVDARGVPSTRVGIEPYSIKEGKFFGYDPSRASIRSFKLESMDNVQILEGTFTPRWELGPI